MFRGLTFALAFTFTASFVELTATTAVAIDLQPTTTIYLPNITKMLGGQDGWNTPFIVQNVGASATNLTFEFRRFSDGAVVKSRTVAGLAPGTSVFHCPNCDNELAAGGQYSVVIKSIATMTTRATRRLAPSATTEFSRATSSAHSHLMCRRTSLVARAESSCRTSARLRPSPCCTGGRSGDPSRPS